MKKTLNMMLAMMAGAMAFTACSSDDILENNQVAEAPSQLKPMTFTAVQEGEGGTRAAIDGLSIKWTAGDKISIFDGSNAYGGDQMFELATGDGETSATFTGSAADAATYYALYPYAVGETLIPVTRDDALAAFGEDEWTFQMEIEEDWNRFYDMRPEMAEERVKDMFRRYDVSEANQAIILAYLKGESKGTPSVALEGSNIKNVVIPAEQTVAAGQTVDPKAMVMVAKGDANTLEFKNVCAYVKVTPQFDCYAICLTSKGTENIAGKVTVNYNEGNPTTTVTADGTNSVSLVGTITAGNAYYIAVCPESLASGFTIEFLTAGDKKYYARSTSKTLALARSNVKNLGEFATDGTWDYANLATSGNDGAGHNWVLMNPTFKALSPASWEEVSYASIPTPWTGWELPGAAELLSFINTVNITFDRSSLTTSVESKGVLKYVCSHKLNGALIAYWTSDPDPTYDSDPVRQGQSSVSLNTTTWVWGIFWLNRNLSTAPYIFKYNN